MRKWIDLLSEAPTPFSKTGDLTGMTFGFESEVVVKSTTFVEEVDIHDFTDDEIANEFGVDEDKFEDEFSQWQEDGHEDGTVAEWIDDIGEAEWWSLVRADGNWSYAIEDGKIVRLTSWSMVVDMFAEDMMEELGLTRVRTASDAEHGIENKDYSEWNLEADGSVYGADEGDHSMELISPVFHSYEDFKAELRSWLAWFPTHYKGGVYTNRTTGLHVNIGLPDAKDKIDPLKLLLFVGEKWVTQHWRGDGNGHTDELLGRLIVDGLPASVEAAQQIVREYISGLNEKSFAINFLTLAERGYVEFRPIGNTNYEQRYDEIIKHVNLFTQAIRIASDPTLYKREYATKLAKLIGGPAVTTLTTPERIVKNWLDGLNFREDDRAKAQSADGRITITPEYLMMFVASLEEKKPIPDMVLRVLIRASGLTPLSYKALCDEYDVSPPWGLGEQGYQIARERLDPMIGS